MIILWIISMIVTAVLTVAVRIHLDKINHRITLELHKAESQQMGWSEGFDSGWNAATTDAGAVMSAYQKIFHVNTSGN